MKYVQGGKKAGRGGEGQSSGRSKAKGSSKVLFCFVLFVWILVTNCCCWCLIRVVGFGGHCRAVKWERHGAQYKEDDHLAGEFRRSRQGEHGRFRHGLGGGCARCRPGLQNSGRRSVRYVHFRGVVSLSVLMPM